MNEIEAKSCSPNLSTQLWILNKSESRPSKTKFHYFNNLQILARCLLESAANFFSSPAPTHAIMRAAVSIELQFSDAWKIQMRVHHAATRKVFLELFSIEIHRSWTLDRNNFGLRSVGFFCVQRKLWKGIPTVNCSYEWKQYPKRSSKYREMNSPKVCCLLLPGVLTFLNSAVSIFRSRSVRICAAYKTLMSSVLALSKAHLKSFCVLSSRWPRRLLMEGQHSGRKSYGCCALKWRIEEKNSGKFKREIQILSAQSHTFVSV